MNMEKSDLPNFPLLFERVAHFLYEVKPVGVRQKKDLRMAKEALKTIVSVLYVGPGHCNARPSIPNIS
jgi:hypothetical protein